MTDLEKVISQVEEEVRLGKHWDESDRTIDMELLENVLLLLKQHEAIKPQLSISGMWYECPICHRHLTKDSDNYCARCGRRVKWS